MNWRSLADLQAAVSAALPRLPRDVDAVVGIPRSGMLPATQIALALELPLADVRSAGWGRWWRRKTTPRVMPRRVLLVDDSALRGRTMANAVDALRLRLPGVDVARVAVFVAPGVAGVDIGLEVVDRPRVFEWNLWRHKHLGRVMTDLDGVLCVDPGEGDNDDGPAYERFLASAAPLCLPRLPVAAVVTSRLERYREQTRRWLDAHGVRYGALHMINLPTGAERRRRRVHVPHKAAVYQRSDALLFVESDPRQARAIARETGRPVLCWSTRRMA